MRPSRRTTIATHRALIRPATIRCSKRWVSAKCSATTRHRRRRTTNYLRFTGGEHIVVGGTNSNDTIITDFGDDGIWGDGGDDRIESGAGVDLVNGGAGDDIITDSGDTGDFIKGDEGDDVIANSNGVDILMGGDGKDAIFVGVDVTEVFGGDGDDFILGGDDIEFPARQRGRRLDRGRRRLRYGGRRQLRAVLQLGHHRPRRPVRRQRRE